MVTGARLPVIIVSGFLGSGKTTLLRRLLVGGEDRSTITVANEFGEVAVDNRMLGHADERQVVMSGGCACCRRLKDVVATIRSLIEAIARDDDPVRRIVIETSGLADPATIAFSVASDPMLKHHCALARIVVTVDAMQGPVRLRAYPEVEKQIAVADEVVITKTDLATKEQVEATRCWIGDVNPSAAVALAERDSTQPDIDLKTLSAPCGMRKVSGVVRGEANRSSDNHLKATRTLVLELTEAVDWTALCTWLSMLLHRHGERVLRVKGIVDVNDNGPVVLNAVQHTFHRPEHLAEWPEGNRASQLVFILRDLEPAAVERSFVSFQAAVKRGG